MENNETARTITEELANELSAILYEEGAANVERIAELIEDGDIDEFTADSIDPTNDAFDRYNSGQHWHTATGGVEGKLTSGQPFIFWGAAQARKGDRRVSIVVADMGDYRVIAQA